MLARSRRKGLVGAAFGVLFERFGALTAFETDFFTDDSLALIRVTFVSATDLSFFDQLK